MARDIDDLILTVRGMTDAGTLDYTIGTITYWSDTHITEVLDRHRTDFERELLTNPLDYTGGGSVAYTRYYSGYQNLEAGTTYFILADGAGNAVAGTSYDADYFNGAITFNADQAGTAYYLSGRSFDLNAAASDIWRAKAGQTAKSFSFTTDNHRIDRGALRKEYLAMADYYKSLSGEAVSVARVGRGDIPCTGWSEHGNR